MLPRTTLEQAARMQNDQELRKAFGARLKELRKKHRWTQKELGAQLGIRHTHLNKYESGIHAPPLEKLVQIAEAFNVSVDFLLTGEPGSNTAISNQRLLRRFQEIEQFDPDDQETVVKLIDAMVAKKRMAGVMQPLD